MITKRMQIQLDENAITPERAHELDAGLDLFTPIPFTVPKHGFAFVDTGVHVQLPHGTRGHICSKSGLNRKFGLTADGTVDEGYTGTVGITVHNDSDEDYHFCRGDKVAQLVIEVVLRPGLMIVDKISGGDRGNNGYGSTGK